MGGIGKRWIWLKNKSIWPKRDVDLKIQVAVTLKSECADSSLPIKLLDLKAINIMNLWRKLYSEMPVMLLYVGEKLGEDLIVNTPTVMPAAVTNIMTQLMITLSWTFTCFIIQRAEREKKSNNYARLMAAQVHQR